MQHTLGSVPQQITPAKKPSRRKLALLAVVLVGLAFGTVHIVHGSTAKHPARHHQRRVTACALRRGLHAGKVGASCTRASLQRGVTRRVRRDPLRAYAAALAPVMGKTRAAFDGAATDVSKAGSDSVDGVCGSDGSQITILQSMTDGVPHPGPWYRPVSHLHYELLGLYHDMLGALQACQTGAENQDPSTVSVASADIQTADENMRQLDDYVVRLSH